jgi:ABC-2 type transport system ATP-binding protein
VRIEDPAQREEAQTLLTAALGAEVVLEPDPVALTARVDDAERVAEALAELTRSGVVVTDFSLGRPSLDEVFMALTGHAAEATEEEVAA